MSDLVKIIQGNCLDVLPRLPAASVQCCVTSPPYWGQRAYLPNGHADLAKEIGREDSPEAYVQTMVEVFRGVRRVLRDDGTVWLNLGSKIVDKQELGIPWRVALALQADGWVLRSDIIWHRVNAMPGSQLDRPSCNHEYIFLLAKQPNYFYDHFAIREPVSSKPEFRNKKSEGSSGYPGGEPFSAGVRQYGDPDSRTRRTVWSVPVAAERESHFAAFPPRLILPCVLAGTSEYGACAKCGTPYARIVERRRVATRPGLETKVTGDSSVDGNRDPERHVTRMTHKGWAAGCGCNAGVVPCVVCDPFFGTGTVGAVAARKGRRCVGIELNAEYVEICKRKIAKHAVQRGFGL